MNELEEKLTKIEEKLGGSESAPTDGDRLGWHLDYIESLIGGGSGSDAVEDVKVNGTSVVEDKEANINLKTINGNAITGEGDITISSGTEVTANPELAGDESALTGLQVGETKYKVGGGVKLYYIMSRCTVKHYDPSTNSLVNVAYVPIQWIVASSGTPDISCDNGLVVSNGTILSCFYENGQLFGYGDDAKVLIKNHHIATSYGYDNGRGSFRLRAVVVLDDGTLKYDMLDMITALSPTTITEIQ